MRMNIEQKIEKQIKEKEKQIKTLEETQKLVNEQDSKNFSEDIKFINAINPFYKKKWNPSNNTYSMIFIITLQAKLKDEIKELKELLR